MGCDLQSVNFTSVLCLQNMFCIYHNDCFWVYPMHLLQSLTRRLRAFCAASTFPLPLRTPSFYCSLCALLFCHSWGSSDSNQVALARALCCFSASAAHTSVGIRLHRGPAHCFPHTFHPFLRVTAIVLVIGVFREVNSFWWSSSAQYTEYRPAISIHQLSQALWAFRLGLGWASDCRVQPGQTDAVDPFVAREANGYKAEGFSRQRVFISMNHNEEWSLPCITRCRASLVMPRCWSALMWRQLMLLLCASGEAWIIVSLVDLGKHEITSKCFGHSIFGSSGWDFDGRTCGTLG